MKQSTRWRCAVVAVVVMTIGCTMKKQEAPALSGPSEFSTSIGIAIAPDVLQQDGVSRSVITVTARGQNGTPMGNVALRAEIRVDGTSTDFGTLSARSLVTSSDGRAVFTYTAPPPPPIPVPATIVDIAITPVGTDFNNAVARMASLRLVPTGWVAPPSSLQAAFSFSPNAPSDNDTVLFDASESQAVNSSSITSYSWEFGDGNRATGRTASHAYRAPGSYVAKLTITDAVGRSGSVFKTIPVGAGANPTVQFVYSPTQPLPGQTVHFDASASRAGPGRRITSYRWLFGNGSEGQGAQTSHAFERAGTYNVSLTVTDDAGRTASLSQSVTVAAGAGPTAAFTFSPAAPVAHQNVSFNGVQSTAADGRQIVSYQWDFGAGGAPAHGVQVTRAFGAPGTYTVTLTVTDSDGRTGSVARQVTVTP